MEHLLDFFADLILFTAGVIVALIWVVIFVAIAIEIYDAIKSNDKSEED